jgi:hypothetical protein
MSDLVIIKCEINSFSAFKLNVGKLGSIAPGQAIKASLADKKRAFLMGEILQS